MLGSDDGIADYRHFDFVSRCGGVQEDVVCELL